MPERKQLETVVTPAGIAKFPRLNSPDTKFNPEGVYKVTLVLDEADKGVTAFREKLEAGYAAALAEAGKALKKGKRLKEAGSPVKPHVDDEGNEVDGKFEISAKMTASGVSKKSGKPWTMRPSIFDAKLKPTQAKVGGGSKLKLKIELNPFDSPAFGAGLSLRLAAVQVIDLVEFSGGGADASGFDEEDGFETPTDEQFQEEQSGEEGQESAADKAEAPQTEAPKKPRQKGDF